MGHREMWTGRGWGRCFGDARGGQLSGAVPEGSALRTLPVADEHRMFQKTEEGEGCI